MCKPPAVNDGGVGTPFQHALEFSDEDLLSAERSEPQGVSDLPARGRCGRRHNRIRRVAPADRIAVERFGGLLIVGAVLSVSFPRLPIILACVAVTDVVLPEPAQLIAPYRDARLTDAVIKGSGAVSSVGSASAA